MLILKKMLIAILLLSSIKLNAQVTSYEDSTGLKIQTLLATAKSNFRKNNQLGESQANEVFEQTKNNKAFITSFIDVHNLLALFKMDAEKYNEAGTLLETGLDLAIKNNKKSLEEKIKGNIGMLYFRKGEYQKCITSTLELLPALSGNAKANALGNIAASYNYLGQYNLSIKYQQEALDIFKTTDYKPGIAIGYNLIGSTYTKLKKPSQALPYLIDSYKLKKEAFDSIGMLNTLINLGENSYELNDYNKSTNYFKQAEILATAIKNKSGLSKIYTNMGVIATKLNNYDAAKSYELKALELAENSKDNYVLTELYKNLGKTYTKTGNLDSALIVKDKAIISKDSLIDLTMQAQIADMQTKYETVKKENQIENQKHIIEKRNLTIIGIVGFALLLSILAWALFNRFRLRKKNELQQKLNEQQQNATINIIAAEEKERKRIATDLHDGVGQLMTAAWLNMQAINAKAKNSDIETVDLLEKTIQLVDESCKEVRAVSHNMMPNALLKKGLINAIREFLQQINIKSTKINLQTENLHSPIPSNVEMVLYRVIQESVNNVIKHAQASSLDISINQDEAGIDVMIEDNGKGFNFGEANKKDGIGLQNIKSRIEYLKGTVEWNTAENKGTLVAIHIPENK